ncbi:sporulation histidine kinase inhibitor Sda [Paenibacillus sp. CAU 1782]
MKRLPDEDLIEAHKKAIELKLESQFVAMLQAELELRRLAPPVRQAVTCNGLCGRSESEAT